MSLITSQINKTVLVTGGTGFIGSNLVLELLRRGYHVASLSRNINTIRHKFLQHYTMNINDDLSLLMAEINPSVIIHTAALNPSVKKTIDHDSYQKTNCSGTINLYQAFFEHLQKINTKLPAKFINLSTYEIFGDETNAASERTNPNHLSDYAQSKRKAYLWVKEQAAETRLKAINLVCANNYGPNQFIDKLIPTIIDSIYKNQKIQIFGDGSSKRTWVYVGDTTDAICKVLETGSSAEYHIGGEESHHVSKVVDVIFDLMKNHLKIPNIFDPMIEQIDTPVNPVYSLDYDLLHQELSWSPQHSLKEGLVKTIKTQVLEYQE